MKNEKIKGPYTHEARKKFGTFKEALSATLKNSYSLASSDLGFLENANDISEAETIVGKYNNNGDDYFKPDMYCCYSYDNPENGTVEVELKDSVIENTVYYSTVSGTNEIYIRERKYQDGNVEYEAIYNVTTDNLIQLSTAMKAFNADGWDCRCVKCYDSNMNIVVPSDDNLREMDEEAVKEQERRDLETIAWIDKYGKIPGMKFSVDFRKGLEDIPSVVFANIEHKPEEIRGLLERHPEIAGNIMTLLESHIEELKNISMPTTYEYNEDFYMDSNFYNEMKNKIVQSMETIKEEIERGQYTEPKRSEPWIDAEKQIEARKKIKNENKPDFYSIYYELNKEGMNTDEIFGKMIKEGYDLEGEAEELFKKRFDPGYTRDFLLAEFIKDPDIAYRLSNGDLYGLYVFNLDVTKKVLEEHPEIIEKADVEDILNCLPYEYIISNNELLERVIEAKPELVSEWKIDKPNDSKDSKTIKLEDIGKAVENAKNRENEL